MNRVTRYKCVYASKSENWKFALTLNNEPGTAEFAVTDADATETLLDMFGDATEVLFDPASAEVTFHFGYAETEEEDEEEEEIKGEEESDEARNAA